VVTGVPHAERLEDALPHELAERPAGDACDQHPEHVGPVWYIHVVPGWQASGNAPSRLIHSSGPT
jgi:hypothetical protein